MRLGWEFNGNWFRWSVATSADAANFVAFWRQIVTTMRAVPGAKFKFCWNPNGPSPTTYSPDQAYPGNAYVDYVGTDVYDNFWGTPFTSAASWVHQLNQQWGLDWLGAFAAEHNEPIAIPEWSDEYRTDGHGLGDDPDFIDKMADWFVTNQVAFANVFAYRLVGHLPQQPPRRHLPQGAGGVQGRLRLIRVATSCAEANPAPPAPAQVLRPHGHGTVGLERPADRLCNVQDTPGPFLEHVVQFEHVEQLEHARAALARCGTRSPHASWS